LRRLGPLGRSTLWVLVFCIVSVATGYLLAPSLLPHYLCAQTEEDITGILAFNKDRGFPGYIGSLDCSHEELHGCQKAAAGQHKCRSGKRTIVLETVCDHDLWVWHISAGSPRRDNDLNVLKQCHLLSCVLRGEWPPRHVSFQVNGRTYSWLSYLADGIYAYYSILVLPHRDSETPEDVEFNAVQKGARKEV